MKSRYALALAALLLSTTAQAEISGRDSKFLQTESQGTAYELAIAKLAEQRATIPGIKSYASMVVSDHEKLNTELHQLAAAKGIDLPPDMTGKQQSDLQHLQSLNGTAFDNAYKQETTRINDEDKKDDQAELAVVTDADIRAFVEKLQAADTKHFQAGQNL